MHTEDPKPVLEELNEGLSAIGQSPKDRGILKAIVVRPERNQRILPTECYLSPETGLEGDHWAKSSRQRPKAQVTMMNARVIALIAQEETQWSLAGDNLYVDLDLSDENIPPGQLLAIGSAVLEVTDEPHTACRKFGERFGRDAVEFVNSPAGMRLRLRGINARVVGAGTVKIGDEVRKTDRRPKGSDPLPQ